MAARVMSGRAGGRHPVTLAASFFADGTVQVALIGTPLRGTPNPREHVPMTVGARGQPSRGIRGESCVPR